MAKKYKRSVSAGATARSVTGEGTAASTDKAAPVFARRGTGSEFNPDYTYVMNDLKRIVVMAGSFVVVLVVLSFFLNR